MQIKRWKIEISRGLTFIYAADARREIKYLESQIKQIKHVFLLMEEEKKLIQCAMNGILEES